MEILDIKYRKPSVPNKRREQQHLLECIKCPDFTDKFRIDCIHEYNKITGRKLQYCFKKREGGWGLELHIA